LTLKPKRCIVQAVFIVEVSGGEENKAIKIIGIIWLTVATALLIGSAIALWNTSHNTYWGINSGAFKATLIGTGYSILCLAGSIGLRMRKNWGRIILLFGASLWVLYSAAYLFMGGYDDTGPIYAAAVSGMFILSIASLVMLARKKQFI
jgi:hypothetical protein